MKRYPGLAYPDESPCRECKHPTSAHFDYVHYRRLTCSEVVRRAAFRADALAWKETERQNALRDAARRDNHPKVQPTRHGREVA